ncbi:MAG TPA: DUF6438 domain-containing protein [Vicinamibacterales bacterium]|nr:DUF6438 domain-containing protein [Vicinamibacterales bacterium]
MPFSPATRALAIAAAATLSNCATTQTFSTVTFERTPCYGTCPVYKVNVSGNGDVKFEGIRNVDSVGTFTGHIDADKVSKLARAFEDAKYFSLQSNYGQRTCNPYATDAARILTSVSTPEQSKSIDHDLGCGSAAPGALPDLYKKFDEIVGTSRWIGNR